MKFQTSDLTKVMKNKYSVQNDSSPITTSNTQTTIFKQLTFKLMFAYYYTRHAFTT